MKELRIVIIDRSSSRTINTANVYSFGDFLHQHFSAWMLVFNEFRVIFIIHITSYKLITHIYCSSQKWTHICRFNMLFKHQKLHYGIYWITFQWIWVYSNKPKNADIKNFGVINFWVLSIFCWFIVIYTAVILLMIQYVLLMLCCV